MDNNDEPLRIPEKDALGETLIIYCAIKDQSAKNYETGSAAVTSLINNCLKK